MAHAHRGSHGGVRLHRVFLQSAPAPLGAPLSQSSTVRKENPQPDHRGLTVTCPRKRGNSKPLVEAAEINIGQQWTQYTALRSTLFGPSEKPLFHESSTKKPPDQIQQLFVPNASPQ